MKILWIVVGVIGLVAVAGGVLLLFAIAHDVNAPGSASVRWWISTHVVAPGIVAAFVGALGFSQFIEKQTKEEIAEKKGRLEGFRRVE